MCGSGDEDGHRLVNATREALDAAVAVLWMCFNMSFFALTLPQLLTTSYAFGKLESSQKKKTEQVMKR